MTFDDTPDREIEEFDRRYRNKPWYRALIAEEKSRNKGGDAIGRKRPSAKGRQNADLPEALDRNR